MNKLIVTNYPTSKFIIILFIIFSFQKIESKSFQEPIKLDPIIEKKIDSVLV